MQTTSMRYTSDEEFELHQRILSQLHSQCATDTQSREAPDTRTIHRLRAPSYLSQLGFWVAMGNVERRKKWQYYKHRNSSHEIKTIVASLVRKDALRIIHQAIHLSVQDPYQNNKDNLAKDFTRLPKWDCFVDDVAILLTRVQQEAAEQQRPILDYEDVSDDIIWGVTYFLLYTEALNLKYNISLL